MDKTEAKIRDLYRIPCGPMEISADSVCRKGLKDSMDKLLDRLTHEIHPVVIDDADGADGNHDADENHAEKEETDDERKERLIKEGKLKAEVKATIRQYEEELQGNSKLLQDISGKIEKW
jgi:hypothetical protein